MSETAAEMTAQAKEAKLRQVLADAGRALVAFSGGVDSTYLLDVAAEVLGINATAVMADSPSLPREHLTLAQTFCTERGIALRVVQTTEFSNPEYLANDGQRCRHCKSALIDAMQAITTADGVTGTRLFLGAIVDDVADYRPGMQAALAAGAQFPLMDCGFSKAEVRLRSQARNIPGWDRPASPCLSSRIPYGEPVTLAGLAMVERAELVLRDLGFVTCRARHHQIGGGRGYLCRIEVPVDDLARLIVSRERLVAECRAIGYLNVCVDLAGFSSGNLNRLLTKPTGTGA